MRQEEKVQKNNLFLYFMLFITTTFLLVLNINRITPLMGEDYALSLGVDKKCTFSIFFNLINEIINHALSWNCRIGELISIVSCTFDKQIFNILNAIFFILFVFLVSTYSFRRKVNLKDVPYLYCIVTMLFLFQPRLGEIFFWECGSTNYLWGVSFLLIFMLPAFLMLFENVDIINQKGLIVKISHIILGFAAGLTNENTVIVAVLIYLVLIIKNRKRPYCFYLSLMTLLTSYTFLLFGPSTKTRRQTYLDMYGIKSVDIKYYFNNLKRAIILFFQEHYMYILLVIFFLVIIFVFMKNAINLLKRDIVILLMSLLTILPLSFVPYTESRAFLFIDFFALSFLIKSLKILFDYYPVTKKTFFILLSLAFAICYPIIFNTYLDFYFYVQHRNEQIYQHKLNHISDGVAYNWQEYPKKEYRYSRLLSDREDYCIYNIDFLKDYYGCNIKINDYEFDDGQNIGVIQAGSLNFSDVKDIHCTIETVANDQNKIVVWGWCYSQKNPNQNFNIGLLDKTANKIFKLNTYTYQRQDVNKAFNLSDNYRYVGIKAKLDISYLEKVKNSEIVLLCNEDKQNYRVYKTGVNFSDKFKDSIEKD